MKKITLKRIEAALNKADYYYNETPESKRTHELAESLLKYGFRCLAGIETEDYIQRINLECSIAGYNPNDPDVLDNISEAWKKLRDRYWSRVDRIVALQVKSGISGLEKKLVQYNNHSLDYYCPNELLNLIDSDLDLLSQQKQETLSYWINIVESEDLKVWYRTGEDWYHGEFWRECGIDRVQAISPMFDWVDIFLEDSWDEPHFYLDLNHFRDNNVNSGFVAVPKSCAYPIIM